MIAMELQALTKRFPRKTAVDHLSFQVEAGKLVALLGVNGAGKTTTIRMLTGLSKPTDGDALLFGKSIRQNRAETKRLVGLSPQETAVAGNLTAQENLELMAGVYGASPQQARQKAKALMEEFSLGEVANTRAKTLSGGWQRRLSIAMGLVTDPKILFLDEPTLGLDVLARRELWREIQRRKGQVTIVLTTHYLEEAEHLSDQIVVLSQGKLMAEGTAQTLMESTGKDNLEDAFVSLCGEVE